MSRSSSKRSTLRKALRYRNLDGMCTKAMDTLTGGPFLAGLALALGASNLQIGLIAAIPFLSKIMFLPAVWVVERFRRRRLISVISTAFARPLLILIALTPFFLASSDALLVLMLGLAIYSILATFAALAWNAWMKDLLPERIRGRVFSYRLWVTGIVGMILSLMGALVVDYFSQQPEGSLLPLSVLFAVGGFSGIVGIYFLSRIPEFPTPKVQGFSLKKALGLPFRNGDFRKLIGFSGSWSFATNMALPFITVYMLSVLGLPFILVIIFTVASQLSNLTFLNIWGRAADRFGNKAVLFLCTPVFSLSLLLWTFTVHDQQWISLTLIALIHVMNGMATAGIDVANDNLLFQLAPKKLSTPYFATAALINSLAAGVAPIGGGLLGNLFATHTLSVKLAWDLQEVTVVQFFHLDFIFLIAFVLGVFALSRLAQVRERDVEAPREEVVKSVKQEIQNISTIKGMRHLTQAASFFAGLMLESSTWMGKVKNGK